MHFLSKDSMTMYESMTNNRRNSVGSVGSPTKVTNLNTKFNCVANNNENNFGNMSKLANSKVNNNDYRLATGHESHDNYHVSVPQQSREFRSADKLSQQRLHWNFGENDTIVTTKSSPAIAPTTLANVINNINSSSNSGKNATPQKPMKQQANSYYYSTTSSTTPSNYQEQEEHQQHQQQQQQQQQQQLKEEQISKTNKHLSGLFDVDYDSPKWAHNLLEQAVGLRRQLSDAHLDIAGLKREKDKLINIIAAMQTREDKLIEEMKISDASLSAMKCQSQSAISEYIAKLQNLQSIQPKAIDLENQLNSKDQTLTELNSKLAKEKVEKDRMIALGQTMQATLDRTNKELASEKALAQQMKKEIEILVKENRRMAEKFGAVEEEFRQREAQFKINNESNEIALREERQQKFALTSDLHQFQATKNGYLKLRNQVNEIAKERDNLSKLVLQLRMENSEMKTEAAKLEGNVRSGLADKDSTIADLHRIITEKELAIQQRDFELQQVVQQLNEFQNRAEKEYNQEEEEFRMNTNKNHQHVNFYSKYGENSLLSRWERVINNNNNNNNANNLV